MDLPIRTSQRLSELLEGTELPPLSGIAAKLVATLSEEQVEIPYLCELIGQDPVLTASMLRWANSPIYGAARTVNQLDAAIKVLGLSMVRSRAIAFYITNAMTPQLSVAPDSLWSSCMRSADCALWLAPQAKVDPNEAWLTAMLVRLGALIIGTLDAPTLDQVESSAPSTLERWQREREQFGFDEGDVMAALTRLWFFPDAMVDALHKCSRPTVFMDFSRLSAVLHLAVVLADQVDIRAESLAQLPEDVLAALDLHPQGLAQYWQHKPLEMHARD